jgi:hypothetical protein
MKLLHLRWIRSQLTEQLRASWCRFGFMLASGRSASFTGRDWRTSINPATFETCAIGHSIQKTMFEMYHPLGPKLMIVSFKLLMCLFHLSDLPHTPGLTKRFNRLMTKAVIFTDDSQCPRILNSSLALLQFVLDGESSWCFSRVGTHCLEVFFGLIRRYSFGDHRFKRPNAFQ